MPLVITIITGCSDEVLTTFGSPDSSVFVGYIFFPLFPWVSFGRIMGMLGHRTSPPPGLDEERVGSSRRGPCCHSALPCAVPIGMRDSPCK